MIRERNYFKDDGLYRYESGEWIFDNIDMVIEGGSYVYIGSDLSKDYYLGSFYGYIIHGIVTTSNELIYYWKGNELK